MDELRERREKHRDEQWYREAMEIVECECHEVDRNWCPIHGVDQIVAVHITEDKRGTN